MIIESRTFFHVKFRLEIFDSPAILIKRKLLLKGKEKKVFQNDDPISITMHSVRFFVCDLEKGETR